MAPRAKWTANLGSFKATTAKQEKRLLDASFQKGKVAGEPAKPAAKAASSRSEAAKKAWATRKGGSKK
jgi:hypothetical protein